ncbi:lytic polysaccharide monooxygenase [Thermoactinomyces sp. CICC 10523]|jgi:predicted carbohydrate-binding protein with CBM5 and CBM33 domain|uniref:lytic polysaccharide monooxygenase n=1 Tax=Thermoactinomyces sp. CICC 10523 TaxID=2767428 RepID=UPI0018DCD926|nr:lytic polysaccharide monooxygenase [Thermoactinomyces sp. CICC 10523]MBH8597985.1 lytic polysaccharide monooxygenase [Thermoactinomyces sp. CICC 10523]
MAKSVFWSKMLTACIMMLLVGAGTMTFAASASAHGYIESPASRAYLCKQGVNTNCGQIQWEPQSVEGPGSFPQSGPPDGQLAGTGRFPELNVQTESRWQKVTIHGGANTFQWYLTAPHATKEWKYYITKKGWNPNKPLSRDELELFCYYPGDGKRPPNTVTHTCNVPTDRSGYHVILGVWEIADTGNAFYQAVDVNLVNNNLAAQKSTPQNTDAPIPSMINWLKSLWPGN